MPRRLPTFVRPSVLAAAIVLASPLTALPAHAATQGSLRSYNVPAGPLASTLNQIASQAGLALTMDPGLVSGKNAAPVSGQYDALGALQAALRGTGLQLVNSGGSYTLVAVAAGELNLPATNVNAHSEAESAWGPTTGYLATRTAAGTKTDTPIAELPRSVSVATREQMRDRAVQNLDDAVRYMPGVIASSYGSDARAEWLKVRGFEPTQFLDGLPLPKGSYVMPKLDTWDLERVALLRGPASSVYGQTPAGGLLDMVSRRPDAIASHEIQAQVGSYNRKQVSFDSTGPLDDQGQFLYRVSGVVRDSGTQIEHIDDKRYNIAPSLTWNIDTDTKLTLLTMFNRDDTGITSQFLPLQGTKLSTPAGKIRYHKNLGDPDWEFYDKTYYALGYAFEHRFNDVWQFRQNLRYTKSDLSFQSITGGSYYGAVSDDGTEQRGANVVNEDISQFAVDNNFQADFATGAVAHTLLLGLDHQRINHNYQWLYGSAPTSNIIKPIYGQDFSNVEYTAYNDYDQKTFQTGAYLQDQMALDNWRLTLGGREDWVHTGSKFYNANGATSTRSDSHFSGNAAISYVFDSGITPYVSYAESFQAEPGGANGAAFRPSTGKQYEAGIKYQPPGMDMLFTAAVYDLTRENIVITTNNGISAPVGEAKARGFELEATGNVNENLKLTASYTYTNTKMTKVDDPLDKNRPLPLTPENQASAWADYTWHQGLLDGFGLGFGVRYVGETDNIAIGSMGYVRDKSDGHTGSYTVYDGAVHYDLGRLGSALKGASVALNANNLFDKKYISTCDGFYCYYGDRRSVLASVNYQW
ncbi:TonB-dependent siderophore receptor [Pseudomonas typographi]|uniref:TonB-dependent siderophore receptor n=1 Tax=Pseudomonas typographi TaxID=2715964 RepID=A0ABR7YVI3_9PSED|nr:TonB-dependent siderophore receptor [Pseudomonas typographi]MBD1552194.1 TonB-dependent siderophore receptor [Pseudomonas typographi]MBD1585166.1 TonB-dependent siderophore receptor [Pseudomonas typographi]MBD1597213.1 TonB-dependent siderophore receptor [Pseudomonas typographi]